MSRYLQRLRLLALMVALLLPTLGSAMPAGRPPPGNQFAPQHQSGADNKRAVNSVKQQYPGSRVLSVNVVERRGSSLRRVKTLDSRGVVKFHYVDENGQIVD